MSRRATLTFNENLAELCVRRTQHYASANAGCRTNGRARALLCRTHAPHLILSPLVPLSSYAHPMSVSSSSYAHPLSIHPLLLYPHPFLYPRFRFFHSPPSLAHSLLSSLARLLLFRSIPFPFPSRHRSLSNSPPRSLRTHYPFSISSFSYLPSGLCS
ncbi:uncharacterized protein SCHCODRAFT_02644182 [Schizophyllum commune H4-8]|uniref:uncharacterized protein n=1 Tax=Schizophyllum commune (strain H4-8 / FGSC 9210) TaxID=578458 RepID=UPI00215FF434|nr:uncharacterized protein SCHCODRAFT_02644182 [Schizophyllum commune H4-8]KAI5885716.1 hypothetical protein SCHCODRAFT_02644182 [Schizophyllum commune H4-8]